jgi:hypothetical protein
MKVEVPTAVTIMSSIIWDLTPCSLLTFYQYFRGAYCLYLQGQSMCFTYPSTLKKETVGCSETFINFYQTTCPHMPEGEG